MLKAKDDNSEIAHQRDFMMMENLKPLVDTIRWIVETKNVRQAVIGRVGERKKLRGRGG